MLNIALFDPCFLALYTTNAFKSYFLIESVFRYINELATHGLLLQYLLLLIYALDILPPLSARTPNHHTHTHKHTHTHTHTSAMVRVERESWESRDSQIYLQREGGGILLR